MEMENRDWSRKKLAEIRDLTVEKMNGKINSIGRRTAEEKLKPERILTRENMNCTTKHIKGCKFDVYM